MRSSRMFMLYFATEHVHKSLSVLGAGDTVIATPISVFLVETAHGHR
jgi:hypothetical protein